MTSSGSSVGITGLGTLIKIGGLAAIIYIIFENYHGKQKANRIKPQKSVQPYGYNLPSEGRARAQKVKIESITPSVSRIKIEGPSDLNVVSSTEAPKSSSKKEYLESSKGSSHGTMSEISSVTNAGTNASSINASTGDIYSEIESPAHILADVKEPETMQALDDTLSSPTPLEESGHPKSLNLESDEIKKKLTAIGAIGCMAAGGNPKALNLLFKHAKNENFLVRYEAIRGILLYGGKEGRKHLQETLPAGDWYILDIRPEDMRKVC